jgi:hypothetical protein
MSRFAPANRTSSSGGSRSAWARRASVRGRRRHRRRSDRLVGREVSQAQGLVWAVHRDDPEAPRRLGARGSGPRRRHGGRRRGVPRGEVEPAGRGNTEPPPRLSRARVHHGAELDIATGADEASGAAFSADAAAVVRAGDVAGHHRPRRPDDGKVGAARRERESRKRAGRGRGRTRRAGAEAADEKQDERADRKSEHDLKIARQLGQFQQSTMHWLLDLRSLNHAHSCALRPPEAFTPPRPKGRPVPFPSLKLRKLRLPHSRGATSTSDRTQPCAHCSTR